MTDRNKPDPISLLMVGIGGYGYHYLQALLNEGEPQFYLLKGVVDPRPESSPILPRLQEMLIPVYSNLSSFYDREGGCDLTVIASPYQHHARQSIEALRRGSRVLCDKPMAATVQDALSLMAVEKENPGWVMIGFQWSFSRAVQKLKRDIRSNRFGKALVFKSLCFWPRPLAYYRRCDWAGRSRDDAGNWILDSPGTNAMAHFIHNMLYLLGEEAATSAVPTELTAELYRANRIENADSVSCRIITEKQVELLFYGSHTTRTTRGPLFELTMEGGLISLSENQQIVAKLNDGRSIHYGSPETDSQFRKLFLAIRRVNKQGPIYCGTKAAFAQVLCANGCQESVSDIPEFDSSLKKFDTKRGLIWIEGLADAFHSCYVRGVLPAEAGFPWARSGLRVNLSGYQHFPGGIRPGAEDRAGGY